MHRPPDAPYVGAPLQNAAHQSAIPYLDVLVRHLRARVYVMHAGWPFASKMIALMWAHPQVDVDVGVIDWAIPQAEFPVVTRETMSSSRSLAHATLHERMDTPPSSLACCDHRLRPPDKKRTNATALHTNSREDDVIRLQRAWMRERTNTCLRNPE